MGVYRFSVSIMPRDGILDPQGRAVEAALPQLDAQSVSHVRIGRRVELSVQASDEGEAQEIVQRLSADFLANPLVESWTIELMQPAEASA